MSWQEDLLSEDKHILLEAAPGSGKTRYAWLFLAEKFRATRRRKPWALFAVPLRVLARSLLADLADWAAEAGVNVAEVDGPGANIVQTYLHTPKPLLLVATYEHALLLLAQARERVRIGEAAVVPGKNLVGVVVDEIHGITAERRGFTLDTLCVAAVALDVPVCMLSGTLAPWTRAALQDAFPSFVYRVHDSERQLTVECARSRRLYDKDGVVEKEVVLFLRKVCASKGMRVLIFADTRTNADKVHEYLVKQGLPCIKARAGLAKGEQAELDFLLGGPKDNTEKDPSKPGGWSVCVATTALAVGVNLPEVDVCLIQLAIYEKAEDLLQMAGRAGRVVPGNAIIFCRSPYNFPLWDSWAKANANRPLRGAPTSFFLQRMAQLRKLPSREGFYTPAAPEALEERAKYFALIDALESEQHSMQPLLLLPQPAWMIPVTVGLAQSPDFVHVLPRVKVNLIPIAWAFLAMGLPEERDLPWPGIADDQRTLSGKPVFFPLPAELAGQLFALLTLWGETPAPTILRILSRELAWFLSMEDDPSVSFAQSREDVLGKAQTFAEAVAAAGFSLSGLGLVRLRFLLDEEEGEGVPDALA